MKSSFSDGMTCFQSPFDEKFDRMYGLQQVLAQRMVPERIYMIFPMSGEWMGSDCTLMDLCKSCNDFRNPLTPPSLGCGGAIVVAKPVEEGEELFLDYNLNKPYPSWAQE